MYATNLEVMLAVKVPAQVHKKAGRCGVAVNATLLRDVLGRSKEDGLTLRYAESEDAAPVLQIIGSLSIEGEIKTDLVEEFPLVSPKYDQIKSGCQFNMSAFKLRQLLESGMVCVASDESRPILTGVKLEWNERIRAVSADGFRLVSHTKPGEGEGEHNDMLWPGSAIEAFKSILPSSMDDDVTLAVGYTVETTKMLHEDEERVDYVSLKTDEWHVQFTCGIMGKFPDYKQIIPTEQTIEAGVPVTLVDGLNLSLLFSTEANLIQCTFEANPEDGDQPLATVYAASSEAGEMTDVKHLLHLAGTDGKFCIGFNGRYVVDILNSLKKYDGAARFFMREPSTPIIIRPCDADEDLMFVLMPMHVKR
jgi:DNA polymerase III sliding clamp (beta) subunit (PCNA family)